MTTFAALRQKTLDSCRKQAPLRKSSAAALCQAPVAEGSLVLPPVYRESHMTIYQPSSSYSASIPRPPVPNAVR
jgi:hypothetical protein